MQILRTLHFSSNLKGSIYTKTILTACWTFVEVIHGEITYLIMHGIKPLFLNILNIYFLATVTETPFLFQFHHYFCGVA